MFDVAVSSVWMAPVRTGIFPSSWVDITLWTDMKSSGDVGTSDGCKSIKGVRLSL
jgi:hypothetical protein